MLMFLLRTNILPAGEDSKQKVATCFYLIFHDNEHFYLFKQHLNSKKCPATCRWRNVSDILISSSLSWQSQWFFLLNYSLFCLFFLQIATWTILLIHHCVKISIILCSISKSTLPCTAVHDYETKNEYSSNRHSSNQSTIQRKH